MECGLSMLHFVHWPCRSANFAGVDLHSATSEIDKGSDNGEAANHCAECSVAEDGRHRKWGRFVWEDWGAGNGAESNAVPGISSASSPQSEPRSGARQEVPPRRLDEWARAVEPGVFLIGPRVVSVGGATGW
jgi:hypothetical protein